MIIGLPAWCFWAASPSSKTSFCFASLIVLLYLELAHSTYEMLTNNFSPKKRLPWPDSMQFCSKSTSIRSDNPWRSHCCILHPPSHRAYSTAVTVVHKPTPAADVYLSTSTKGCQSATVAPKFRQSYAFLSALDTWLTMTCALCVQKISCFRSLCHWANFHTATQPFLIPVMLLFCVGSLHWGIHVLRQFVPGNPSVGKHSDTKSIHHLQSYFNISKTNRWVYTWTNQ